MAHRPETFLRAREVIEHAIAYAHDVAEQLARLAADGRTRAALLASAFAESEQDLLRSLERYRAEGTAAVLDTFVQYALELPDAPPPITAPLSPDAVTEWVLRANRPLAALFDEASEASEATPARYVFANLADLVETHEQRISQAADGASDL